MSLLIPEARGENAALDPFDDELAPEVRFALLGRLEVIVGGRDVAPTTPRALQLLAMLLLHPGHVVGTEAIVGELWGERPPRRARSAVQTHVYHLRRCIEALGISTDPESVLRTRHPGYQLDIDPRRVDLTLFRAWSREGRDALRSGRVDRAAELLRAAEDLWSGPPLANVGCGSMLAAEAVEVLELRRAVRCDRIDAEIDQGRHRELVGELVSLTAAHPLDEVLHTQLIKVLARCGRRSDAMAVFHRLRRVLSTELGVEPGEDVTRAHHDLIRLGGVPSAA